MSCRHEATRQPPGCSKFQKSLTASASGRPPSKSTFCCVCNARVHARLLATTLAFLRNGRNENLLKAAGGGAANELPKDEMPHWLGCHCLEETLSDSRNLRIHSRPHTAQVVRPSNRLPEALATATSGSTLRVHASRCRLGANGHVPRIGQLASRSVRRSLAFSTAAAAQWHGSHHRNCCHSAPLPNAAVRQISDSCSPALTEIG